ncbi:MAG: hypothetical protein AAFV98_19685 [Chloroflexota bacterium]
MSVDLRVEVNHLIFVIKRNIDPDLLADCAIRIDLPTETVRLRVGFYVLNEDGSTEERYLLNPDGTSR